MLTTPRGLLSEGLARLTERLALLRAGLRRGVVEAVSATVAEAAEGTLAKLVARWRPVPVEVPPDAAYEPGWDDDRYPDPDPEEPEPPPAPSRWKGMLVAGLHALAWWLPRYGPACATAAVLLGAAVLLLD